MSSTANIYLDVDGVLIDGSGKLAAFGQDFLQFVLAHFPDSTYWLTSYCWQGNNNVSKILSPLLDVKTSKLIREVKPSDWKRLKIEAIDFKKPFFWYDDNLFAEEKTLLEFHNAMQCYRPVNLKQDPHQLMDEIQFLKYFVKHS